MTQRFEFPQIDPETHDDDLISDDVLEETEEYDEEQSGLSLKLKIVLISIGAALFLGLIAAVIGLLLFAGRTEDEGLILDNVFAGGIELSGMTTEEAANALHLATDNTFTKKDMVVQIHDDSLRLSPEDTMAALDVEAVIKEAYEYGRSGTNAENIQIQKNAKKRSYTIPLLKYLTLDTDYIKETVVAYCESTVSSLSEPVISLEGQRPVFDPTNPGAAVTHQQLHITLGTPEIQLDPEDLYEQILDGYSLNELFLEYEAPQITFPSVVIAQKLFDEHCTSPIDASMDPSTYAITEEVYGYGFDPNLLQQMLDEADYGENIDIYLGFLTPAVVTSDLTQGLFTDTLAQYCSIAETSISERNNNIQLSCQALEQLVIEPGETFSFNKALQTVSEAAGYQIAAVSTHNSAALAGGISQTASALYYCALLANLDIIERHSHQYAVDFIDLGLDAYVDGSFRDLRFRNNTSSPIRITTASENGTVTITLKGVNTLGYKTNIQTEIMEQEDPMISYQIPTGPDAQSYRDGDTMVSGIPGYFVSVSMEKIDLATGVILSTQPVSTSLYEKKDTVLAQIAPPPPTEPTETVIPTETIPVAPNWQQNP